MSSHRPGEAKHGVAVVAEHEAVGGPGDGIGVPLGDGGTRGEVVTVDEGRLAAVVRAVDGGAGPVGFADVFHNIGLTACGPITISEHPPGGPAAGTAVDPNTGFGATVQEIKFVAGVYPGGDEVKFLSVLCLETGGVGWLEDELAVFFVKGFGAVDVGLKFVVVMGTGDLDVPPFAIEVAGGEVVEEDDFGGGGSGCGVGGGRGTEGGSGATRGCTEEGKGGYGSEDVGELFHIHKNTKEMDIRMTAVATVKNKRAEMGDDFWGGTVSEIELADGIGDEAFDGIEGFSNLEIIYHFDRIGDGKVSFARRPRGNPDYPKMGIFAQRNKDRPNWIGLATVELLGREGRIIRVRYLDAIDGTPVLDIKPVFREFMPKTEVRQPEWVGDLLKDYWK
jgi:tRNA-Thr(GGU) m(6)t(6)A37 methyltransferase TsaA